MTVYELIQELARYDAEAEVGIRIKAKAFECSFESGEDIFTETFSEEKHEVDVDSVADNCRGRFVWLECDLQQ